MRLPGSNPVLLQALFSLALLCPPCHPASSSPCLKGTVRDSELFTPHGPHSPEWIFPLPSSNTYLLSHSVSLAFSSLESDPERPRRAHCQESMGIVHTYTCLPPGNFFFFFIQQSLCNSVSISHTHIFHYTFNRYALVLICAAVYLLFAETHSSSVSYIALLHLGYHFIS